MDSFKVRKAKPSGNFTWADNEVIDTYGKQLGVYGVAVYMTLARYVFGSKPAFVKKETIAEKLGISVRMVHNVLDLLISLKLIEKRSGKEKGRENQYALSQISRTKTGSDSDGKHALPNGENQGEDVHTLPKGSANDDISGDGGSANDDSKEVGGSANDDKEVGKSRLPILKKKTNTKKTSTEENNKVADAPDFVLPEWIDPEAWNDYTEMRASNPKKKMTPGARKLIIGKLAGFRDKGFSVTEILNNSTMQNWTGVFEPNQPQGGRNGYSNGSNVHPRTQRNRDAVEQVCAEIDRQDRSGGF